MLTAFLDLIVMLAWPLVMSAAAWAIAVYALAETDEIASVVEFLTRWRGGGQVSKPSLPISIRAAATLVPLKEAMQTGFRLISDWHAITPPRHQGRKAKQNAKNISDCDLDRCSGNIGEC